VSEVRSLPRGVAEEVPVSQSLPPDGWYPDPAGSDQLRRWDGATWTSELKDRPEAAAPVATVTASAPLGSGRYPVGKQFLRASFALFRQNRSMIWLPIVAGICAAVTFLLVSGAAAVALVAITHTHTYNSWREYLVILPGGVASSFVSIYASVALAFACREQIEGRDATMSTVLALAWTRRRVIFSWALLSSVVGTVVRFVEQRAGILGRIIGVLGGLAWAVATFMVIPVLAFEDVGPWAAVERSGSLLKRGFGVIGRSALRFGAIMIGWSIAALVLVVAGIDLLTRHQFLGWPCVIAGVMGIFVVSAFAATAGIYLRTILYRYLTNQSTPDLGVDYRSVFNR